MVAARNARRRTGSSGKIIPNSQSGREHTAAEIADGKERDEDASASSRCDGSRGGDRAQESYGKQCEWQGTGTLRPEDCAAAGADSS